jgi:hypothetical protein
MDHLKKMNRFIRRTTVGLSAGGSLLALWISGWQACLGVWIGAGTGLIGYQMIISMVGTLSGQEDGRTKGTAGYAARYVVYALIFGLGSYLHFPVLSMLVGFLCHKASLFIYTYTERNNSDE